MLGTGILGTGVLGYRYWVQVYGVQVPAHPALLCSCGRVSAHLSGGLGAAADGQGWLPDTLALGPPLSDPYAWLSTALSGLRAAGQAAASHPGLPSVPSFVWRSAHRTARTLLPRAAEEPGALALLPGATLVLWCHVPCGPGVQEHLTWVPDRLDRIRASLSGRCLRLPLPVPLLLPRGERTCGGCPKGALGPDPESSSRTSLWSVGLHHSTLSRGLSTVGKMLLDPEPIPSDRRCPMFGPKGGVETHLGSSGPVCLLTCTFLSCVHSPWGLACAPAQPCAQEGCVWSRAEAHLHDTQAWEPLEVPCSCQGSADGQAFSLICIPVGSQQPAPHGGTSPHPSRSESAPPTPPRPVRPREGLWVLAPRPSQREVGWSEARPRGPSSEAQTPASSALTARP